MWHIHRTKLYMLGLDLLSLLLKGQMTRVALVKCNGNFRLVTGKFHKKGDSVVQMSPFIACDTTKI